MPRPPAIDPRALINILERTGITCSAIAREVGVTTGYITLLARGDRGKRIGNEAAMALQRAVHVLVPNGTATSARASQIYTSPPDAGPAPLVWRRPA